MIRCAETTPRARPAGHRLQAPLRGQPGAIPFSAPHKNSAPANDTHGGGIPMQRHVSHWRMASLSRRCSAPDPVRALGSSFFPRGSPPPTAAAPIRKPLPPNGGPFTPSLG